MKKTRKSQRIVYVESRKDLQTGKEKILEKVYTAFIVYIRCSEECKVRDLAFTIKTSISLLGQDPERYFGHLELLLLRQLSRRNRLDQQWYRWLITRIITSIKAFCLSFQPPTHFQKIYIAAVCVLHFINNDRMTIDGSR